ncbi:MAG: AAA family ATPase [Albidovulum sp.]|nr:AAA family ATPase [Albidovulum sp.]
MSDPNTDNILELEVNDFGPIAEAKIDPRPLTVFIGPSNTGKSYLAILIYALHRYFSSRGWPGGRRFSRSSPLLHGFEASELAMNSINGLHEFAESLIADTEKPSLEEGIALPGSVMDAIRSGLEEQGPYFGNEVARCFGIEEGGALIRKGGKGAARIGFRMPRKSDVAPIEHGLTIGTQDSEFNTKFPLSTELHVGAGNEDYAVKELQSLAMDMISPGGQNEDRANFYAWRLLEVIADHFSPQIVGPLHRPAFYLPADRTGIMHAHSVVVSALIKNAAMTGLRPAAQTPMLSGVLADFLEQLINLDLRRSLRRNFQHDLDKRIERSILHGSIGVDKSETIGYPRFTYRPERWNDSLSLMNASSMVSELAPVVLYLRHVVGPGNVLIVEEPEAHLHPAMQVQFTRQIAAFIKNGIRVILTTHSEWVLEELSNIVHRSELSTLNRDAADETKTALHPDSVGVWLFKQRKHPTGSLIQEIKLDKETGLFPTDYDFVSEELYNESAKIFSRIQKETVN